MSYDLIYDKCFIKVDDNKYLQLIKIGCNNLTDDNGKRIREWEACAFYQESKILYSKEELTDNIVNHINQRLTELTEQYKDEKYKRWDDGDFEKKWTIEDFDYGGLRIKSNLARYKDIINLYKNGVKHAIKIDDFLSNGNHLVLSYGPFGQEKGKSNSKRIESKEDVIQIAEQFILDKKDSECKLYINVRLNGYDDSTVFKPLTIKENKQKKLYPYYFVLGSKYSYYKKRSSRRVWGTDLNGCKKFKSEKEAEKILAQLTGYITEYKIIKINKEIWM